MEVDPGFWRRVDRNLRRRGSQACRKRVVEEVAGRWGCLARGCYVPSGSLASRVWLSLSFASLLRKAQIAFAFIAFGAIIGALALRAGHDPGGVSGLTARIDQSPSGVETVDTIGHSTAITAAEMSPPREQTACQGDTYLDAKCVVDKVQKRPRRRAANDAPAIAAVALGRSALSLPDVSSAPPKSTTRR
jgi:hypothetical protein